MLVLTRKTRESIQINQHITVTVLKVRGNTVRLGIDAPRHVRVVRGELRPHTTESSEESPAVTEEADSSTEGSGSGECEVCTAC